MARRCCFIGEYECEAEAEFQVLALRQAPEWPFPLAAGPDPLSDDTDACREHVGALLGWQPEATETNRIYWEVRPIEAA